jgi:regulator of sigma E protease
VTLFLAAVALANIWKIVLFLVMLSVLVVLHEYGHFLLARLNKVRVIEFAVGMGPLILGRRSKRSGTLYSLRALPIGGYCAMHGEDNRTSQAEQQREFRAQRETVTVNGREYDSDNFQAKTPAQRLAIVLAGPVANFILTFLILFASALFFGIQTNNVQPRVGPLSPNMPAARAGLRVGDLVLNVNGTAIRSGDQLVTLIHNSLHKQLRITYMRDGSVATLMLTPTNCPPPESAKLGCIGFSPWPTYARVGFREAVSDSISEFSYIGAQTFGSLALLASHPVKYGSHLTGVVGMGQAAITVQDFGWGPYLFFAALISFALGVFNLLPLPALDGGRAAFIIGELVRGKPVDPEKEAWVHITGFAVLIALMLVINFYNIVQIVQGKGPF